MSRDAAPTTEASLRLTHAICQALIAQARAAEDREICGFLACTSDRHGPITRYVIHNRACQAASRFEMDPAQQIAAFRAMRERGEQLIAIYHSHPTSPAIPSAHDLAGHSYPGVAALIISPHAAPDQRLRAWALNGAEAWPITLLCR